MNTPCVLRFVSCLALLVGGLCAPLRADQVTLKNGDRLTGAIVKSDNKALVIKSEFAGTVTIAWDAITGIEAPEALTLTLQSGQVLVGPITTADGKITVSTKDAGVVETAKTAVQVIRSPDEQKSYEAEQDRLHNPHLLDLWAGTLDTAYATSRGNSSTDTFTLGFNATRATPRDKVGVYLTSIYADSKTAGISSTTADAVRGGVNYNLNLSPKSFVFAAEDLEFDKFQKLDLRSVTSIGAGYHVVKQEHKQFDLFAGGALDKSFFSDNTRRTSGEVLFGDEIGLQVTKITAIHERAVIYPNVSQRGNYRITFDSSAITTLSRWLAWNVTLSDRYLSDPVSGAKPNDLLFTTGIRVTFKR